MAKSRISSYLYEGVVIVASILVAFALDAMWANSQEREVEQRLLKELLSEFRAAETRVDTSLEELRNVVEASGELLSHLGPEAPPVPAETLEGIVGRMMQLNTLEVPSSTLDSIIAGGQLSLIENDELRKRLLEWPALFDDVRENHEWHREETDAYLVPAISPYVAVRNVDMGFPEGFIRPSSFELDPVGLQRDPVFEGRLMNRMTRQGATAIESRVLLEATVVLIKLIESEIG